MKKRFLKGSFFLKFLCVCAAFVLNIGTVRAADWASLGEAPVDGKKYYLYNPASGKFVSLANNKRATDEPTEALLLTAIASGDKFKFQFTHEATTNYLSYYSVVGTSEYAYTCKLQSNGLYQIVYTYMDYYDWGYGEDWIGQYYIKIDNNGSYNYTDLWGSTINDHEDVNCNWAIISEETYLAQGKRLYYAATAEANYGGSAKVAFENPVPEVATASKNDSTAKSFATTASITAYFKAIPDEGYEFVGWKKSPAGGYVSFDENYSETFDATSTSEASPTTFTMYAYFEKESEYEVELLDKDGNATTGSFADKYAAAGNGYSIVLHKNIDLGSTPLTIDKNITIDFNNRAFIGTVSNLVTIASGKTVTFADNSSEAAGGVRLSANTNAEVNAVQVNGTLKFYGGVIKCENTSEESEAKAAGLTVASSGALELKGGKIDAKANSNAYGLKNEGAATLTMGSINATAATNAYGVLAKGTTNITWSVAVNATTTSGDNAVGVLIDHASAKATIDGGVITVTSAAANAYGVWAKNASEAVKIGGNMAVIANAETTTTAYAIKENGVAVNVETGRFASNNTRDVIAATAANLKLYGGYYVHEAELATYKQAGVTKGTLQDGTKFYTEGYRYILSNGDNPNYVVATAFGEGFSKKFGSLEDAILYANNNPETQMTIRLEVKDYTLPTGNYTIPGKATLLIPYERNQIPCEEVVRTDSWLSPTYFSKLIVQTNTHIDVLGTIELGSKQNASGQNDAANGAPSGSFGWMYLEDGSQIVVSNGGILRAWGYVTGPGSIDVRRGAKVHEQFQILDWKGGTHASNMCGGFMHLLFGGEPYNEGDVFPINQYFIQNIESQTTYRPGSKLFTSSATSVAGCNDVQIIGAYYGEDDSRNEQAMFLMNDADVSEDTWVRKWYNVSADRQTYDINNSAFLGSIVLDVGGAQMKSSNFNLPLTNNMDIHLLDGEMSITQNAILFAGASIDINKKAIFKVPGGKNLYLYDQDEWDKYVYSGYYAQRVKYTPTLGTAPTVRPEGRSTTVKPQDAAINIKGALEITGNLYTTIGGANIYSDISNAGVVKFVTNSATNETVQVCQANVGKKITYVYKDCTSAKLKNGDATYKSTAGTPAGNSFCYLDINNDGKGEWHDLKEDGCFVYEVIENETIYYAKPQDYVELLSNEEDPVTHLYSSKVGGRKFICIGDCEWWEVEDVEENDALVHCTHPDNDKYYYYDADVNETWMEKEFTITWVTKPYEELEENQGRVVYNVDYKSMPKYLGTNPSRPMNAYYTYDFTGWLPALVPVTDDAIYVAQFQQNDRKYMITFLDEDGSVLEEALWKMGDVPAPVNEPTPSGKKLVWEPLITAVNGDATYRATYTDIVLPAYEITFVNWDGTQLQKGNVNTNTIPEYTGSTPTKAPIADVAFEFEGWTPDLAPVTENAIYTAKFREKPATYTIVFMDGTGEGDPVQIGDALTLGYGETPVCSNPPTKASTEEFYYTVIWSPLITAVTGNATYTATGFAAHKNTCRLTVSAGANGQVRMADGEWKNDTTNVFDYDTSKQIEAKATTTGYSFKRWSDGNKDNPRTVTVNAAISLTAEFALNQYEITWNNEGGALIEKTTVNHGVVPSHVAPTKATDASNTYSFAGWSPTPVAATGTATYTATFNATPIEYTIRIVLNNGMNDIVYEGMHYNDEITIGTPVKASKNGVDYTFSHWTNSADENIGTTIPNVTQNEIYYAQYDTHINDLKAGNSEDANAKDLALTETGMEAQSLIIEPTGTVNITGSVTVQNFILESNGSQSGQLLGNSADRLTINEHAYFDLTLNAQRRTWYAVAVPWAVDCRTGISIKGGRHLVLGSDFDLVYYQGNVRASEGAGYQCWKYAEDGDGDKIMHPGRLYMMYFGSEIETIRFENYDDTPFNDAVTTVSQYSASESDDANWNGIANPMAYHATMSAGGATYGYYLNNGRVDEYMVGEGEPTYKLVNLASYNAIVGKPLFIQAVNTNSITTTPKIAAAPRRIREIEIEEGIETVYEITFGAEGSDNKDNIFIQTVETKEEGYVIGQDLLKAGMSAKLPQLWINQYGKKLSVNTATPMNGVHEYPLTLNIPQAGDYTIAIESTQGDTEALYLIKDGNVIWNLSNGEYTGTFEKGTDASYSLRTAAKSPQTATGIDEALIEAQGEIQKVIINDHVYIIRGEQVYTIDGQLVK